MSNYIVQQGDNLTLIARRFGIKSWRDLYNHPKNVEFRRKRPNPNIIMQGDSLFVPGNNSGGQVIDLGETVISGNNPIIDLGETKIHGVVPDNKNVNQLTEEEKKQILDEALKGVPSDTKKDWEKFLTSPGTAVKVFQLAEIAGIITEPLWTWGAGILGGFIFYYKAITSVINAWETNQRMYGYRAEAYTITAWAFGKPRPHSSPSMLERFRKNNSDTIVKDYQKAWDKISIMTWQNLERAYKEKKVSKKTWQIGLQFEGFQNKPPHRNSQENLCYKVLKMREDEFGAGIQLESWRNGYKTLYPR